jgi:histone deacetylase 11
MFLVDAKIPFDTERYGKIVDFLKANGVDENNFFEPSPVSTPDLMLAHSSEYLAKLDIPQYLAAILELQEFGMLPVSSIKKYFLGPVYLATGGTILGCQLAISRRWAINLSGGYHHAKTSSGGGFCVISDIAIAIKKYWQAKSDAKILIVDLDAHQGTGYAEIFLNNDKVFIFDVYNRDRPPVRAEVGQDIALRARINFNYPVAPEIRDEEYLKILADNLPAAILSCKPDLIIYIAGTDVFCNDPAGGMQISQAGILRRDEYVFSLAEQSNKPILMLLAGGYSKQSAEIFGRSILNILRKKGFLSSCSVM